MSSKILTGLTLLTASVASAAFAQTPPAEFVPLEIQQVRIVQVTSIPTRGSCQITGLDVTLTPADPSFSIATGCTEVTVMLDGNRIVASRVPAGEDFYVSFRDMTVDGPTSEHPYVPILVSQHPGQSSRISPSFDIEGTPYLDASGFSHPTCDCDYTFPAPSGRTIQFPRGIVIVRADEQEFVRFSALFQSSAAMDADGDGEHDGTDRCPGTAASTPVDAAGCSHTQFCEAIDTSTWPRVFSCLGADWMNDSPFPSPRDCMVADTGCTAR